MPLHHASAGHAFILDSAEVAVLLPVLLQKSFAQDMRRNETFPRVPQESKSSLRRFRPVRPLHIKHLTHKDSQIRHRIHKDGLAFVVTLIILVPVRPSRENVISMPSLRRNVCARRSRPASARGFFTHAGPPEMSSRALSAHNRNRSDALPVQVVRSIMIARTQVAIGSASMMLSMAARRFAV